MLNKADPDFTIILNEYDENGEKIVEHRFKSEQMYWEYYELLQAIKRMNRPNISEEEYQKWFKEQCEAWSKIENIEEKLEEWS